MVLVAGVQRAAVPISARLADELHLDARHGPLGAVDGRAHRYFAERPVIEREAGRKDSSDVDPLDHRPIRAGCPVSAVRNSESPLLPPTSKWPTWTAGVAVRMANCFVSQEICELTCIEASRDRGRLRVDDRRLAFDVTL